jgi:hypothetical protein
VSSGQNEKRPNQKGRVFHEKINVLRIVARDVHL